MKEELHKGVHTLVAKQRSLKERERQVGQTIIEDSFTK